MRCVGSHRQPGPPSEPRRAGRCGSAHVADPGPVTTLRTRRDTPRHRRRPWGSPVRSAFPPRRRPCATSMIQSVGRGWRRECDARCHGHVTSQGGGRDNARASHRGGARAHASGCRADRCQRRSSRSRGTCSPGRDLARSGPAADGERRRAADLADQRCGVEPGRRRQHGLRRGKLHQGPAAGRRRRRAGRGRRRTTPSPTTSPRATASRRSATS